MFTSNKSSFHGLQKYRISIATSHPGLPFIKCTYNVHLSRHKGTKAAIQVYKTLQTSKRIMPIIIHSCAFVVYSIYFETFRGGNPLFGWKLPKARRGGVGRRRRAPLLAEGSPPCGGPALVEILPGRVSARSFSCRLVPRQVVVSFSVRRPSWSRQYVSESSITLSQCDARTKVMVDRILIDP